MSGKTDFWDKHAKIYNRFMRRDAAAYERMYELLRPVVRRKTVLELATGTGLSRKILYARRTTSRRRTPLRR